MSSSPVLYSVGFALSEDGSQVLLLQKDRPAFLAGQWGGVGGHIEEGETPLQAMEREAQEEADLVGVDWQLLEALDRPEKPGAAPDSAKIYMFAAKTDLARPQGGAARTLHLNARHPHVGLRRGQEQGFQIRIATLS